ncbi:SDR family oxidoreductase [Arthrobacter sp. I2-34]|uniref:SDR family oxidoreductase n=1 Tax=Arthrobacter hankyongi TaxID=2904801 RepID=A0ABS9L3U3_9MICC|nr:SDR family oxidoreductase [Arthrobacter hankyongi]MCG2621290.1 SDR family oxidoreductase [Arthrobacter hankyongi]
MSEVSNNASTAYDSVDYVKKLDLGGRGVVVLGAGQGIGGAVADAVSQAGGRVLCVDIDAEQARRTAERSGGEGLAADVTDRAAMEAVFQRAEEWFGDDFYGIVDVVGVTVPQLLADTDEDSIQRQFDLVLRHALLMTQIGIPKLARRGRGSVVYIGSLAGVASTKRLGLYGAAKAAVHQLSAAAAHEFGPAGVRVNTVVPGRILASGGDPNPNPDALRPVELAVPLGRGGHPDDIASATLFLLSDLAGYISGVQIPVDGGISVVTPLPSTQPANRQG